MVYFFRGTNSCGKSVYYKKEQLSKFITLLILTLMLCLFGVRG
jgi:hypothetical protein